MRAFDLSPLYRASVGFDQMADLMDRVLTNDVNKVSYPPYNIEKKADDTYRISVAVAGFSEDELSVEVRDTLPRSTIGKILKKELRAPYWEKEIS